MLRSPWNRLIGKALVAIGALTLAYDASADRYPDRPVKIIVPWPAGGIADVVGRIIQPALAERLGQPIVIENRTGGNGIVAAGTAKNAAPDGYTLFLVTSEVVSINPGVYERLPYDVSRDFVPVAPAVHYFYTLTARNGLGVSGSKELVSLAKSQPGKLTYGSWGIGSVGHLGMEMLCQANQLKMLHVPYTGGPAAYHAVVAGQIDTILMPSGIADPFRQKDRLKAVAVPTEERLSLMETVPTMREQGYDLVIVNHVGFVAPAGTPRAIVDKLNSVLSEILQLPAIQSKMREQAAEPFVASPEKYADWMKSEERKWREVAEKAGIKLEL